MIGSAAKCARLVLAIATVVFVAPLTSRAQPAAGGPEDISLFIGLSRGDLSPDDDDHLRVFVVLQEHVNLIRAKLASRAADIRTGDLPGWKYNDWQKLRPLPITHYIVANPKRSNAIKAAFEVEWHIGKFSGGPRPDYVAIMKDRTIIGIPGSDERAALKQRLGENWERYEDFVDSANRVVGKLEMIFPEMRAAQSYFVDCLDPGADLPPAWKDAHVTIMAHLSQNLQNDDDVNPRVRWRAVWAVPSREMVAAMCKDLEYQKLEVYRRGQAQFYVGGGVKLREAKVQPDIKITVKTPLPDDRARVADDVVPESRAGEIPPLREFCMSASSPPKFRDLEMLTAYIQARAFKVRPPPVLGDWKCP